MSFVALVVLVYAFIGLCALCDRGDRIPGPSWFEIPHEANRAARRGRGR